MARHSSSKLGKNTSGKDLLALWITERVGTMSFFLIIFVWTTGWLLWNMFAPKAIRFDPFPGFVLWLFISNMIQLFLMPLIMIGQNLQGREADARAESDYKINCKAEKEIQEIKDCLKSIMDHHQIQPGGTSHPIDALNPGHSQSRPDLVPQSTK